MSRRNVVILNFYNKCYNSKIAPQSFIIVSREYVFATQRKCIAEITNDALILPYNDIFTLPLKCTLFVRSADVPTSKSLYFVQFLT